MKPHTNNGYNSRVTIRLSENQFHHIKSQDKSSDYVRMLIERDMSVVQDEQS
jgi:hypothetical protein